MQLSKRLQAVADSVTKGNKVADVGCDHAYISIYLIQQHIAPQVIAMDVNKGPLERGRENIKHLGLSNQIDTRLSDGLQKLTPGEVDTILIAGMGGALTVRILEEGLEAVKQAKELILQPQSELFLVRKFIKKINFQIIAEQMLIDDGKYYTVMKAYKVSETLESDTSKTSLHENKPEPDILLDTYADISVDMDELYDRFGPLLLKQRDPIAKEYLEKEKMKRLQVIGDLTQNPTENSLARLKEVQEDLGYIEAALAYYK